MIYFQNLPKLHYYTIMLFPRTKFLHTYNVSAPISISVIAQNPCVPSPCGSYSECRDIGGTPSCSCLPTYMGSPPNCRPECIINSECRSDQACMNQKCRDPCIGSCGISARCNTVNHIPICICSEGYTGDPFNYCHVKPKPRMYTFFSVSINT